MTGFPADYAVIDDTLNLLKRNWSSVVALADALVEHRRIEGRDVDWIIDRA